MSHKHINARDLNIKVCIECGKRLHRKDTNVCDECLARVLTDSEPKEKQQ